MASFFNNIVTFLVTENTQLVKHLSIPFSFIEALVYMLFFTSIFNMSYTKKQKYLYIGSTALLTILCTFFIPSMIRNVVLIIGLMLLISRIFKVPFIRGVFATFLVLGNVIIGELIVLKVVFVMFNVDYNLCTTIPLYKILGSSIICLLFYVISKVCKFFNFNISFFNSTSKHNKLILILNACIGIVILVAQMYLIIYHNGSFPQGVLSIQLVSLITYMGLSIFSMSKTLQLAETSANLKQEQMYNKTLQILHDNVRSFKHDFSNIVAGIGGYVDTKDLNGLQVFYHELLKDCEQVNNLSTLNPSSINNPAVYALLSNKYYEADSLGIKVTIETFIDFNKLNMGIYEFTRILGILLNNAIEAASECEEKEINIIIRVDPSRNRQLLIIRNTYNNKDVDMDLLFKKGYSTKKHNTGLGLWEVDQIINKHTNLTRFTSKTSELFTQQIEMYDK